jgi:diguanylate cyclase (GGDEF)-like protein
VVLLPNASALIGQRKAEELRAKIERLTVRYADGDLPRITISVGVATFPDGGSAPMEVLKVADNALYVAKAQGRNRVELSASGKTSVAAASSESPHAKLSEAILDRLAQSDDEAA